LNLSTKAETVKVDLGGRDENEVISALFEAEKAYEGKLDYDTAANPPGDRTVFLADDGYNSNSFTAGVLEAVGLEVPELKSRVPGYDKPIPEEQFKHQQE
jgi:hypothetical protein